MRRKDREITDLNEILTIMKKCNVVRLAFFDEEYPYIIPANFGLIQEEEEISLLIHGAKIGKKLDLMKLNNKVGFEMDCSHKLITGEEACDYTMEYESLCGNGTLSIVPEDVKLEALKQFMKQYTTEELHFNEKVVNATLVLKLRVNEIFGKHLMKK